MSQALLLMCFYKYMNQLLKNFHVKIWSTRVLVRAHVRGIRLFAVFISQLFIFTKLIVVALLNCYQFGRDFRVGIWNRVYFGFLLQETVCSNMHSIIKKTPFSIGRRLVRRKVKERCIFPLYLQPEVLSLWAVTYVEWNIEIDIDSRSAHNKHNVIELVEALDKFMKEFVLPS